MFFFGIQKLEKASSGLFTFATCFRSSFSPFLSMHNSHNPQAKVFRVYYSKPIEDESDDYLVDHTIIMYLMDPEFQFAQYFGQFMTAPEMAQGMAETMEKYIPPP